MLFRSHVPFEEIGFPKLDSNSLPDRAWPYMAAVPGIVVGVGGLMSAIYWVTKRRMDAGEEE
mgnify:FL=1